MPRQPLSSVQLQIEPTHVRVRLCRPERYNVLDISTLAELAVTLDGLAGHQCPLVIEGDGGVFSLGADVRELANFSPTSAATYSRLGQQTVRALETWPGVTIARIDGYALGTGLELALGCDVLVAGSSVRLGLPGLAWALVPCLGGLRRLQYRVGAEQSRELFLRGVVLDGPGALESGLVDRVVDDEDAFAALIRESAEFTPSAVAAIRALRLSGQGEIDSTTEAELFAQPFISGECQRRLRRLL